MKKHMHLDIIYNILTKNPNASLASIGKTIKVSTERVRQIIHNECERNIESFKGLDYKEKILIASQLDIKLNPSYEYGNDRNYLLAIFLKSFRFKISGNIIYKSYFNAKKLNIHLLISEFIYKNAKRQPLSKTEILNILSEFSSFKDVQLIILDDLIQENLVFIKGNEYYLSENVSSKKSDIIFLEISKNFKTFSLKKDIDKLYALLSKYEEFKDMNTEQINTSLRGIISYNRKFILVGNSTYTTKLSIKKDYSNHINILKGLIATRELYSITEYFKKNSQDLEEFASPKEFYSFLRTSSDIKCARYPFISTEEIYNKLKSGELRKDIINLLIEKYKPENKSSFFGLSNSSKQHFFS